MKKRLMAALLVLSGSIALAVHSAEGLRAEVFEIDAMHSGVGFSIRHLMVSRVHGSFTAFSGKIEYDPKDPKTWKVEAVIDAASINTGIKKRDDHLRNPDFFDVAKFPTITFKSTAVEKGKKKGTFALKGDLTMHGVTRPVTLALEPSGELNDREMGRRVGFNATGTINRKDFGLSYNKVLEAGGVALGEEVEIVIDVAAVPPAAEKKE